MVDDSQAREILDFVPRKEEYTFNTECFFITHRALELGLAACLDHLTGSKLDMNRDRRISKNYPKVFGHLEEDSIKL